MMKAMSENFLDHTQKNKLAEMDLLKINEWEINKDTNVINMEK